IFGAGHISTFLSPLAKRVGFSVVVIDDRGEFANTERFPDADEIMVEPLSQSFDRIAVTPSSYIAIITRGHIHDHAVLKEALKQKPAYIGMIGSKRKREIIYQALIKEGTPKETLQKVHSPIGLAIGAETPEEIAVSIVAELIQERERLRKRLA
ncbi:XdhC family protein, partial [Patescibacteria group bacterium]|nr:XdhC family protein [Patescibacteria group bacterium]